MKFNSISDAEYLQKFPPLNFSIRDMEVKLFSLMIIIFLIDELSMQIFSMFMYLLMFFG